MNKTNQQLWLRIQEIFKNEIIDHDTLIQSFFDHQETILHNILRTISKLNDLLLQEMDSPCPFHDSIDKQTLLTEQRLLWDSYYSLIEDISLNTANKDKLIKACNLCQEILFDLR